MHHFRRKGQLLPVQLSLLEKMIEERALITIRISLAGNKSSHMTRIFYGDLDKLAFP